MAADAATLDALAATPVREVIAPETFMPIITSSPFIPSRSMLNLRDVGAVPGSSVPAGRFYRCGTLEYASKDPEALAWLAANVRKVFDLRKSGSERDGSLDPVLPGVENVWLPGAGSYPTPNLEDFAKDGGVPAWKTQYLNVALIYRPMLKAVVEHIRDRPREPILFHCTGELEG